MNVTTRRQSQQVDDDPQPLTKDAAPPSVPAAETRPQDTVERGPKPRPLVRAGKMNRKRDHAWFYTSYFPLPDEDEDDDVYDLVADARDAILAVRFEHEVHDHAYATQPDDVPLPVPLTVPEILTEQSKDEYCQSVLSTQVG